MTAPHSHLTHPKYRPDIDGLRAVAVLSVVAFHAFPSLVSGGFIGVDVFFVISGFLISTIIFGSLDKEAFSFAEFYSRRIKRIFPALTIVLFASFVLGWFVLLPDEYKQLGKHTAGGASFIANLMLWRESGYFDNSAETKPLLHLWSLGIEEQFYLLWPIVLCFARKLNVNLLTVTITAALASFLMNISGVKDSPIATFYSPQTRFWELLAGSWLAWFALYKKDSLSELGETPRSVMSILGLSFLMFGFVILNKDYSFPGMWAVLPVFGAVLIITAGPGAWVNRNVLSNKLLVWFGLISFPLYLWHWPLLSFARIMESAAPSGYIRSAAVVIAVILAWLTYRYVERAARSAEYGDIKVFALSLAMIGIAGIGWLAYVEDGFKTRPAAQLEAENNELLNWSSFKTAGCETDVLKSDANFCLELGSTENQKIAVIGDSTGNAIAPGLAKIYEGKGRGLVNFGSYGCPPIRGIPSTDNWAKTNDCVEGTKKAYRIILESKTIDTVVLAIFARDLRTWGGFQADISMDEKFNKIKPLIDADISELKRAGKNVIVTYDAPYNPVPSRECLERPGRLTSQHKCDIDESQIIDRQPFVGLFDGYFSQKTDVCIVRQSNVLIKNKKSQFFDADGKLLLRDNNHLSYRGSDLVADEFVRSGCLSLL